MKTFFKFTKLVTLLSAASIVHGSLWGIEKTDSYDDLGQATNDAFSSDGGVVYNQFSFSSRQAGSGLPGVNSASPPNRAAIVAPAQGSIATTGRCFDLRSMYIACAVSTGEAAATVPAACTMSLTAYGNNNVLLKEQSLQFTPTRAVVSEMQKKDIDLPPAKLVYVEASIDLLGLPLGAVTAGLFDNVTYVEYDDSAVGVVACGVGF